MFNFFKKQPQKENLIEVKLNKNDLLIIQTDRILTLEQRHKFTHHLMDTLGQKGNQVLVLEAGFTYSIIHRD